MQVTSQSETATSVANQELYPPTNPKKETTLLNGASSEVIDALASATPQQHVLTEAELVAGSDNDAPTRERGSEEDSDFDGHDHSTENMRLPAKNETRDLEVHTELNGCISISGAADRSAEFDEMPPPNTQSAGGSSRSVPTSVQSSSNGETTNDSGDEDDDDKKQAGVPSRDSLCGDVLRNKTTSGSTNESTTDSSPDNVSVLPFSIDMDSSEEMRSDDDSQDLAADANSPSKASDDERSIDDDLQGLQLDATPPCESNAFALDLSYDDGSEGLKPDTDNPVVPHKKSRKRKSAIKSQSKTSNSLLVDFSSVSSTVVKRESGTEVGSLVYAQWEENGGWYVAEIIAIKRKKCSHYDQYSLLFYDGDFIEYASRKSFITSEEYKEVFCKEIPPPKDRAAHAKRRRHCLAGTGISDELQNAGTSHLSLEELLKLKCGKCVNCEKGDCGQCASCKTSNTRVCIQKMCCAIPIERKAQPMPASANFPGDWKFVIDPTMEGYLKENCPSGVPEGLKLLPPSSFLTYYSVERAQARLPFALKDANATAFYDYIGVDARPAHEVQTEGSFAGQKGDCGTCETCQKAPCGRCFRCRSGCNESCFQKMCVQIPVEAKAAKAVGFPDGWRFYFGKSFSYQGKQTAAKEKQVPNLWLFSPGNKIFRSVDVAVRRFRCKLQDREEIKETFYEYVGLTNLLDAPLSSGNRDGHKLRCTQDVASEAVPCETSSTANHFLVGRALCLVWTDLNRQVKLANAIVTACEKQEGNDENLRFRVTYDSQSRQLANLMAGDFGLGVPETQMLPAPLVLGGCVLHHQKTVKFDAKTLVLPSFVPPNSFYWEWITPDVRFPELVENRDGVRLPRLTLVVKGFRLELNVKTSTIPDAGFGVFLRCRPFGSSSDEPFVLKAGELVDLGIYAPFRIEDMKNEAVFFAKNFIFSRKCEGWVFNAEDENYHLDITDDVNNGEIHDIAKSNIPAYVNETKEGALISIQALHDPEGSVHYLLGHTCQHQGSFELAADGSEIELFVNYGEEYERVRIRNNYSFVSNEERERLEKSVLNEDIEDVEEMNRFEAADIDACATFLFTIFASENDPSKFAPQVSRRALVCAVVLQYRAYHLLFNDLNQAEKSVAGPTDLRVVSSLVSLLLGMARNTDGELRALQAAGKFKDVLRRVFKEFFSANQLHHLEHIMS